MLLDSQDVFFFPQSWIMSALLSSLSPSQSHTHYVRRMSLNSNQGKIIASIVYFLNVEPGRNENTHTLNY